MAGAASESFLRFLRGMTALGLAVAVGGGVILTLEANHEQFVEVIAGRGPGVVTLLAVDDAGDSPFTSPFAVALDLDPSVMAAPPRSAALMETPHRRHSVADRMTAQKLVPALARGAELPDGLTIGRIEAITRRSLGNGIRLDDLVDRNRDRYDDDGRYTVSAVDGSSVCVSVTNTRVLARALGAHLDADGVPTNGITWSPYGSCSDADLPRPGADVRVGTTPGTYGASRLGEVCDIGVLGESLVLNPTLAAAWVAPLGLSTDTIPSFLASLTPVVLLADTAVTDHALRGDRVASRQVVLQRGTAVLVDPLGIPVVRCMSGSPLRAPQSLPAGVEVEGEQWAGFTLDMVKRIPAGETTVSTLVLVEVRTGEAVERPVGTAGRLSHLAGSLADATGG